MSLNKFNLIKPRYIIKLEPGRAVNIGPGVGYNMNDSLFPVRMADVFTPSNKISTGLNEKISPHKNALTGVRSYVINQEDYKDEAEVLAVYFKGKYGIVNGQAAYSQAKREIENKVVKYIVIEVRGDVGYSLAIEDRVWKFPPIGNEIADKNERLGQFVDTYGSHYISEVYYGQKIMVRASLDSKDASEVQAFTTAIRAASGFWNAKAGVDKTEVSILRSTNVDISTEIIGDITPISARYPRNSIDSVMALFEELLNNQVSITSDPLECQIQSFWPTLDIVRDKNLREVLNPYAPTQLPVIPAPYGVPIGTLVAWRPNLDDMTRDAAGNIILTPPEGWAICDGNDGRTPKLDGFFLYGTTDPYKLNDTGGQPATTPKGIINVRYATVPKLPNGSGGDVATVLNTDTDLIFQPQSILPPYYAVIYIMKI